MEDRSLVAATAGAEGGTAFVSLELSEEGWLACWLAPGARRESVRKFEVGDVVWLQGLVARLREAKAVRIVFCYEAGRDGFWLQRVLTSWGVECLVIDASSVLVDRRARRAKTDRLDVRGLLRALMQYLGGDARACRVVRVPSPEVEEARRPGRERERLLCERVRLVNRMLGRLATVGPARFAPLARDARAQLAALRCGDGSPLPPALAAELGRTLDRLDLVCRQIATLEAARDAAVKMPPAGDAGAAQAAQLMRLKGIGPQLATLFAREVFWRRFDNRRQVGAYLGLDGRPWQSGAMTHEQGISKAGNPRARTAAIEAAWLWLEHQPDSALSTWFRARFGAAKGLAKRRAAVAVARKLVIALWRYLETGLVPEGAVLKKAG